ncbi:UNVERIFIED_ORG: O-antigen/teichoic acid export membrane protein [Martelella mediterranea]
MKAVSGRILKGSGASAMSLVARTFEQLLLVPILLAVWSVDLYGEWLLISAVPIYFAMSDLGFLQAGSNELARRTSQEDEASVKRFFREYTSLASIWSLVILVFFVAAVFLVPLHDWLGLSILTPGQMKIAFVALLSGSMVSMNTSALLAGLRVRKLYHVGLTIRAVSAYLRILVTFIQVYFFAGGPVEIAIQNLIFRTLEYAVCAFMLKRVDLAPTLGLVFGRSEKLWPLLLIGMEYMLMPLAYSFSLQGMTVATGTILGAAAVAVFGTHRTLTRTATTTLQMFVQPLRAEAGLMQRNEDVPALRGLLVRLSRVTFWMSMIVAVVLVLFGGHIFRYWTHGRIEFETSVFLLLLLASVLEGIWRIAATIRLGSNRHRPLVWGFAAFSAVGVGCAFVLGPLWGLAGMATAVVIPNLAMCVLTIGSTTSLLKMTVGSYLVNIAKPPLFEAKSLFFLVQRKLF